MWKNLEKSRCNKIVVRRMLFCIILGAVASDIKACCTVASSILILHLPAVRHHLPDLRAVRHLAVRHHLYVGE
jgi:hypothetical protein